jgi:hypothetical protein
VWGGLQRTGDHYRIGPRIAEFAFSADRQHAIPNADCAAGRALEEQSIR